MAGEKDYSWFGATANFGRCLQTFRHASSRCVPHCYLKLRGMLSYDGGVQHAKGFENRKARALKTIEPNVQTFEMMKKAGLNMEIFSGGGSGTHNIMHLVPRTAILR